MSVFGALDVYRDLDSRSGALNMAIDEALLEATKMPSIRFYRWDCPALSFGYFGRFADVARYADERDLVRRWTGGGVVFHGQDLTYSIVIPASDPFFSESSMSIYEKVHCALRDTLLALGQRAVVAAIGDRGAGIANAGYSCFANPVDGDLIINGRKIAGAAQRRTRAGLLQQGSIQHVDLANGLTQQFANALSGKCEAREIGSELLERAQEITAQKYGTKAWLQKR